MGTIDGVFGNPGSQVITGWACAEGNPNPVAVHLYLGGPAGSGAFGGQFYANLPSPDISAINSMCESPTATAHRFSIHITPSMMHQFGGRTIWIHGISPTGLPNNLLSWSGKYRLPVPLALNSWASDFTGDGKADYTVWDPGIVPQSPQDAGYAGIWGQINSSTRNPFIPLTPYTGQPGDMPVPGTYLGGGITQYVVWRPTTGQWLIGSRTQADTVTTLATWGLAGDVPVPGDYDRDGKTDIAVWRPSNGTWYVHNSSNGQSVTVQWGLKGDVPVPGDYDGDSKTDMAVWRPSNGIWYIRSSSSGQVTTVQWGLPGDLPVPGDYDGDGKTDFAVYRPSNSTWYILNSSNRSQTVVQWGLAGDVPVPSDYDGDMRTDFAVWRPSTETFYVQFAKGGSTSLAKGSTPAEVPVPVIPGLLDPASALLAISTAPNPAAASQVAYNSGLIERTEGTISPGTAYSLDIFDRVTENLLIEQRQDLDLRAKVPNPQARLKPITACIQPGAHAPVKFFTSDDSGNTPTTNWNWKPFTAFSNSSDVLVPTVVTGDESGSNPFYADWLKKALFNVQYAYNSLHVPGMPAISDFVSQPAKQDGLIRMSCSAVQGTSSIGSMQLGFITRPAKNNIPAASYAIYNVKVDCNKIMSACENDATCFSYGVTYVLAHEVGHIYGLSDDYKNTSSVMQEMNIDTSSLHITSVMNRVEFVEPVLNEIYNPSVHDVWSSPLCWDSQHEMDIGGSGSVLGGNPNPQPPGYTLSGTSFSCLISCPTNYQFDAFTCTCSSVYSTVHY